MDKSTRLWQLISLVLALALISTLVALHRSSTARDSLADALPAVNDAMSIEQLAMSPNARRVHERYAL